MKKKQHGGARKGSGAKKKPERLKKKSKVIRVPQSKPDFVDIASKDQSILHQDTFVGFVYGCNYVWDKYISRKSM